jgi:hypothetical protein
LLGFYLAGEGQGEEVVELAHGHPPGSDAWSPDPVSLASCGLEGVEKVSQPLDSMDATERGAGMLLLLHPRLARRIAGRTGYGPDSATTSGTTQLTQQPGQTVAVRKYRQPRAEVHAELPCSLQRDAASKCARPMPSREEGAALDPHLPILTGSWFLPPELHSGRATTAWCSTRAATSSGCGGPEGCLDRRPWQSGWQPDHDDVGRLVPGP